MESIERITEDMIFVFPTFFKNIIKESKVCHEEGHKFSHAHVDVLFMLMKEGTMPVSEAGKRLGISKPQMTVITDKLIEEKFIERLPDKNDRRIINLELTQRGKEYVEYKRGMLRNGLKEKLSVLSEAEQTELADALDTVKEIIKKIK